jgi:hypothetical protein
MQKIIPSNSSLPFEKGELEKDLWPLPPQKSLLIPFFKGEAVKHNFQIFSHNSRNYFAWQEMKLSLYKAIFIQLRFPKRAQ